MSDIELNQHVFKYIVASFITRSSVDFIDNIIDIFVLPVINTDENLHKYKIHKIHVGKILINIIKISIYCILIYFIIKYT